MTPELREAEGYFRAALADPDFDDGRVSRFIRHGWAVVKAYLAEHLADDAEPVTAEWLGGKEVVWQSEENTVSFYTGFAFGDPVGRWCACINGAPYSQAVRVPTRGHVRRLCDVLGVPLKEPARC